MRKVENFMDTLSNQIQIFFLLLFFYRNRVKEYYPEIKCRKKLSLFKNKEDPEYRMVKTFRQTYEQFGSTTNTHAKHKAIAAYLDICRKLPFYGQVFIIILTLTKAYINNCRDK